MWAHIQNLKGGTKMNETTAGLLLLLFIEIVFMAITLLIAKFMAKNIAKFYVDGYFAELKLQQPENQIKQQEKPVEKTEPKEMTEVEKIEEQLKAAKESAKEKVKPKPKVSEKKVFKCPQCGKEFDTDAKLRRHYGMAHIDKIEVK